MMRRGHAREDEIKNLCFPSIATKLKKIADKLVFPPPLNNDFVMPLGVF